MVCLSPGGVLPDCYGAVAVEHHEEPISVDLEIARWLADEEVKRRKRPTVLFRRIKEHPGAVVLGNPYPRPVMLAALGTSESEWLPELSRRLATKPPAVSAVQPPWTRLSGLDVLPVLKHRPGDCGRYITSGIGVTRCPDTGRVNLGVYRIQVTGKHRGRIFFDPRTDAFRNWRISIGLGRKLPISVFLGANPVYMMVAASRLPADESDYAVAARLLGREIDVSCEPPVPTDATYVITGEVSDHLEMEGPFAEFKGYYVDARPNPVLEVTAVYQGHQPVYPAIVTGKESGLTLMAMQNEYLLFTRLVELGYTPTTVSYPLAARAEFLALVEVDRPSEEIVHAAMEFDRRVKFVICGPKLSDVWDAIATIGFSAWCEPYVRKGKIEGRRVGLVLNQLSQGIPVEY